jgi:AraC-like DNA-binding protein
MGEPNFDGRRGCRLVVEADGFAVCEQQCDEHRAGWVGPGHRPGYTLNLPRTGGYEVRVDGREHFLDPTVASFEWPGQELYVAHPLGPCAVATLISVPEDVGAGELANRVAGAVPRTGRFELWHWALVAACRRGVDAFEVAERAWALLDLLPSQREQPVVHGIRPGTEHAHRRLVSAAREVLATGDYSLSLGAVAGHVGCSAAHLSRVFRRTTGRNMTSYRNELRVRAVLRDLTDGATSLRTLAATYGFADQAHLSRVAKMSLGMAPSRARTMLSVPSAKGQSAKG